MMMTGISSAQPADTVARPRSGQVARAAAA